MSGRILVVDDVAVNRFLLKAKLEKSYYEVFEAEDGKSALEQVENCDPDLILLDVFMPEMNGFEVCRRIKSNPATSHIPIVFLTASDSEEEKIRGFEAGADDFLQKPFHDMTLFARVKNLTRSKFMFDDLREQSELCTVSEQARSFTKAEVNPNARILIAANTEETARRWYGLLEKGLSKNIYIARDERETLRLARDLPADLVLIHHKPFETSDGLRLVANLAGRHATRYTALVVVCSNDDNECVHKALDLGASDYIYEPFVESEFLLRVRSQLLRKQFRDRLLNTMHTELTAAITDQLTGLHNRRFLASYLTRFSRLPSEKVKPASVIMCDIDFFKSINDTYGHDAGDVVIREVAQRFQEIVRAADLVLRWGGEEFVVILPEHDEIMGVAVAERMRHILSKTPVPISGTQEIDVTASFGVAALRSDFSNFDDAIKHADAALYRSKGNGRNRVTLYENFLEAS